jgi:hypothetical protein
MNDTTSTHNIIKIVFAVSLAFTFPIVAIQFVWEATRRPTDLRSVEQKRYETCVLDVGLDKVQDCEKYKKLDL